MSNLTKIINIFIDGVDKSNNKIYNVKCMVIKTAAVVLLCSMFTMLLPVRAQGNDFPKKEAASDGTAISMECIATGDGLVKIRLASAPGVSLCGLYAVICYESDVVQFKSQYPSEALASASGVLSCVDREGELFVMIDLSENFAESELGELVFKLVENNDASETCFELKLVTHYRWEKDILLKTTSSTSLFLLLWLGEANGEELRMLAIETAKTAEEIVITMYGIAPRGCFAAGFEVYVVELSGFSSRKMSLVGVLGVNRGDGAEFSRVLELPMSGKYCVIIKPSAYYRNRVECGDELVILIENGSILY